MPGNEREREIMMRSTKCVVPLLSVAALIVIVSSSYSERAQDERQPGAHGGEVVRLEAESLRAEFAQAASFEGASGGMAVSLVDQRARLSGKVTLKKGFYRFQVQGKGPSYDADAVNVTLGERKLRGVVAVGGWGGAVYELSISKADIYDLILSASELKAVVDVVVFERLLEQAMNPGLVVAIASPDVRASEVPEVKDDDVVVELEQAARRGLAMVRSYTGASGGKAVDLFDRDASVRAVVELTPGQYEMHVRGYGKNTSTDGGTLTLSGHDPVRVVFDGWEDARFRLSVDRGGPQQLSITTDEPGYVVDRVLFREIADKPREGRTIQRLPRSGPIPQERPGYVDRAGAAIPRPRLLLTPEELNDLRRRVSEDAVCRKHFAAVRDEASGNLLSACLAYLVSQRDTDLAQAKGLFHATIAKGSGGNIYSSSYRYADLCIAFDWLHDALTPEERVAAGRLILDFTRIWEKRYRQPDWANQMYQMKGANLLAGIALRGAGIDDFRAERLLEESAQLLRQHFVPAQAMMLKGNGGMIDGTGYWFRTAHSFILLLDAWRSYSGEDLFDKSGIGALPEWVLRVAQPHNGRFINWHDNSWQRQLGSKEVGDIMQPLVARCQSPVAKLLAERGGTTAWRRLLWDDPQVPTAQPGKLPLHRHHEGIGMVTMRSDWSKDATYAVFVCGDYVGYHDWASANMFYISKRGSLIVDAAIYDNSKGMAGDKHPYDAHNTILIGSGPSGRGKQAGRWPELKKGSEFDLGDILAYEEGDDYVYVCGDATRAYHGQAKRFRRHFLFLLPNTFVIYDEVETASPDTPVRWMIHGWNKPVVNRSEKRMTFTEGDGVLACRTLLPEHVRYVEDVGSYEGNGHTGFGVAIEPARKGTQYEFLHVLEVGGGEARGETLGRGTLRVTTGARKRYRLAFTANEGKPTVTIESEK